MIKFKVRGNKLPLIDVKTKAPKPTKVSIKRDYTILANGRTYTRPVNHGSKTWQVLIKTHPTKKSCKLYHLDSMTYLGTVESLVVSFIDRAARKYGSVQRNFLELPTLFSEVNEKFLFEFDPEHLDNNNSSEE